MILISGFLQGSIGTMYRYFEMFLPYALLISLLSDMQVLCEFLTIILGEFAYNLLWNEHSRVVFICDI